MSSRVLAAHKVQMAAKCFNFDPSNIEHAKAYLKLEKGIQSGSHRFLLVPEDGEPLFENVLNLMRYRLAQHCCKEHLKEPA
jgi:hypothetical protein